MTAALTWSGPAFAQDDQERPRFDGLGCREVRNLDATQYWFWDAYFGVVDIEDFPYDRWGRLAIEPTVCLRIRLAALDDAGHRTAGYRQAVPELLKWVAEGEPDGFPDPDSSLARQHLERITGRKFDTRRQWIDWWSENQPFVLWSEDSGHLEVVEDAREAGESLGNDSLVLDAEGYWFYAGRGWLSERSSGDDFLFGSVRVPPHGYSFRVPLSELSDRSAKERGYRRALENLVVDGLMHPELGGASLDSVIKQMSALTGQSFVERSDWIRWWTLYRTRLVLSADGQHLIPRSSRRH